MVLGGAGWCALRRVSKEGGTTGDYLTGLTGSFYCWVGFKAALELEQVRCWDCFLGTLH